jgi:peptidoglycan hydrolase-like protein with peptidoglycan-binding domain
VLGVPAALAAQGPITLTVPTGSVIMVRTNQPLVSASARVGDTFETTVVDTVEIDGYTVIPAGSRIRGVVAYAQPADRSRSGVMQVSFDRLTMPDGTTGTILGKLTSTDPTERRQIEQRADSRVVLVGGRGGIGAAIAGAGSDKSPVAGVIAALGNMLSEARDVNVPQGTVLAVQLEQPIVLRSRGASRNNESTIYTKADRIRAAQQALQTTRYYRGSVTGLLDNATRSALFEYQLAKGLKATGNLDGRTAKALGLQPGERSTVLSANEANVLRRAAEAMVARVRTDLGISTDGRMDPRRNYSPADVDLLFAMSAFADNTALYEQITRATGTGNGEAAAGRSLIEAARRVDSALNAARPSAQVQNVWESVRRQLQVLDPSYR